MLSYYQQALEIFQILHKDGPNPDVVTSLDNVGATHVNLGDIRKGLSYQQHVMVGELGFESSLRLYAELQYFGKQGIDSFINGIQMYTFASQFY